MGDAHHGHAFQGQGLHHVEHFTDHFRVEGRGGLVKQHHLGLHGQGSGNGDSLLLAARQARWKLVGLLRNTDLFQQRQGLGLALLLAALAHDLLRQAQVFQHGHVGEQVEVLEHHADFTAVGIHVGLRVGQLQAVDAHRTRIERLQPIQAAQEGGLAGPRRTDHHQHLALGHLGGDVIHRAHQLPTGIEDFYQIAYFNHFGQASAQAGWPSSTAAG